MNTIGRTCLFSEGINKHALLITKTKVGAVRFWTQFLPMLHHRFANAAQVLLCGSDQVEVEEHEKMNQIAPT